MERTTMESMVAYLQGMMDSFKKEEGKYGIGDRLVQKKLDAIIACKEMVEALIGQPVNLQQDGKVTVGYQKQELMYRLQVWHDGGWKWGLNDYTLKEAQQRVKDLKARGIHACIKPLTDLL